MHTRLSAAARRQNERRRRGSRAQRRPGGRRRDGRAHALDRLVDDRRGPGRGVAPEPADGGQHPPRVAVRHDGRLGTGAHALLQRRLQTDPRGDEASFAGQIGPVRLPGDLVDHRTALRRRHGGRRGQLRRPARSARSEWLPRGVLLHVLLQPHPEREPRGRGRPRDGHRVDDPGRQRPPPAHAPRPGGPGLRHQVRVPGLARRGHDARKQRGRRSVRPALCRRRRRRGRDARGLDGPSPRADRGGAHRVRRVERARLAARGHRDVERPAAGRRRRGPVRRPARSEVGGARAARARAPRAEARRGGRARRRHHRAQPARRLRRRLPRLLWARRRSGGHGGRQLARLRRGADPRAEALGAAQPAASSRWPRASARRAPTPSSRAARRTSSSRSSGTSCATRSRPC